MKLIDSLRSLFTSSAAADKGRAPSAAAGRRASAASGRKAAAASSRKLDVEARFERLRSAVTGTMGNFFVARDREQNRIVGVKICDSEKVALFENRFKGLKKPSEGEIAVGMQHPRIVETYEYGVTTKGERYLVMEYIDGPSLQQVVQAADEQAVAGKRLNLIRQMAEAIQYVHGRGFIHRDICPRNFICLSDLSGLKLIDFGLTVPATPPFMAPGNRTGTPIYMSPEIVRRKPTDARVDIFSFGVSCYCLCTFQFPWPIAETNGRAALQHDTSEPTDIFARRPDLDRTLGRSIMQCMHPDVQQRTPSMERFLQQIQSVQQETVG